MRVIISLIFTTIILLCTLPAQANEGGGAGRPRVESSLDDILSLQPRDSIIRDLRHYLQDTTANDLEERNRRFYDSLATKSERSGFWKFIHKLLIVERDQQRDLSAELIDETRYYSRYEGREIVSVEINRIPIFERAVSLLEKGANAVHVVTQQYAIRRDLMFKSGDLIDPELIVQNKQLLRSRDYLYDAEIVVTPLPEDSMKVNVLVVTNDSWTISLDGALWGMTGRVRGDIYDANILGSGNRLRYRLSLDWKAKNYEGSMVEYYVPNFLGTFFHANVVAGRSFWETTYSASVNKPLIRNSDYVAGLLHNRRNTSFYMTGLDDTAWVKYHETDAWAGVSHYLPMIRSSIYGMGRFYNIHHDFRERNRINEVTGERERTAIEVGEGLNPYFHNRSLYLATFGLYGERFITTNLIYGYGFDEYVARGYTVEFTGGYLDSEFDDGAYGGLRIKRGDFYPFGYLMGDVSVGTYYSFLHHKPFRSTLDARLDYFTNLLGKGRTRWRQFISMRYLKGWNRSQGWEEVISFTPDAGLRDLKFNSSGTQRFVLNAESVMFTPWQPIGFRVALYAFADVGFLGYNNNVFRNDVYSAIGLGIRLKNEMLVFSTIQLSFSVAFGKRGLLRNEWINMTNERRLSSPRYIPGKPDVVRYH